MRAALEGIRVLEWSYIHLGPEAASILGDLGAEVIKIEDLKAGDPMRALEMSSGGIPMMNRKGTSGQWERTNRSKKSVAIDLKKIEGQQIVYRLLPKFDVFLGTFRRVAAEKVGMDYETLKRYNPRLIYAHATAFGPLGPDAEMPGQDLNGQSRAGMALAERSSEEEPRTLQCLADQMGSVCTAFGILAALLARERLGVGQKLETSLLGGAIWLETSLLNVVLSSGQEPRPPDRKAALNPLRNFYRARDGKWVCLSMNVPADAWWSPVCRALGRPELELDPRFCDQRVRRENCRELIRIMDEVFQQRTQAEWLERFRQFDCAASPVNRLCDSVNDPQVIENQYIIDYEDPVLGKQKAVGFPVWMSETPMRMSSVAPEHGQHTEEVLLELGGYNWDDIASFKEKGVIL